MPDRQGSRSRPVSWCEKRNARRGRTPCSGPGLEEKDLETAAKKRMLRAASAITLSPVPKPDPAFHNFDDDPLAGVASRSASSFHAGRAHPPFPTLLGPVGICGRILSLPRRKALWEFFRGADGDKIIYLFALLRCVMRRSAGNVRVCAQKYVKIFLSIPQKKLALGHEAG